SIWSAGRPFAARTLLIESASACSAAFSVLPGGVTGGAGGGVATVVVVVAVVVVVVVVVVVGGASQRDGFRRWLLATVGAAAARTNTKMTSAFLKDPPCGRAAARAECLRLRDPWADGAALRHGRAGIVRGYPAWRR